MKMNEKPKLCWWCNGYLSPFVAKVLYDGHVRVVHKCCKQTIEEQIKSDTCSLTKERFWGSEPDRSDDPMNNEELFTRKETVR